MGDKKPKQENEINEIELLKMEIQSLEKQLESLGKDITQERLDWNERERHLNEINSQKTQIINSLRAANNQGRN